MPVLFLLLYCQPDLVICLINARDKYDFKINYLALDVG